jgi:hypothetical protein
MLTWLAPWWTYIVAAVYVLTFFFNARRRQGGPLMQGGYPCGLRSKPPVWYQAHGQGRTTGGDVLEAVNGQPLAGMPDWFLARAQFQRVHPVQLQIRRGEQHP